MQADLGGPLPGLFGVVCIDLDRRIDPAAAESALDTMEATLLHHPGLSRDRWIDSRGRFAIGRVGLPQLLPDPLRTPGGTPVLWMEGIAHAPGTASLGAIAGVRLTDHALRELHGFWVLAHHDTAADCLTLAVDRRASVPLVHTTIEGLLVFAPEPKALLAFPGVERNLDPAAASSLLVSGFLPAERTLLRGAARMRGGTALEIGSGGVVERTYWEFAPGSASGGAPSRDLAAHLAEGIGSSVRRNLGDPRRTVIFLSGGADSRVILAAALDAAGGDGRALRTVTWGSGDSTPGSDLDLALKIAAATGVQHEVIPRTSEGYAEGFRETNHVVDALSDVAAFHPQEYGLMRGLRERGFECALRGDEAFGWSVSVHSHEGAAVEVGLRRLEDVAAAVSLVRPEHRETWVRAAAADWARHTGPPGGESPNQAKDRLYFGHRVQGMLGPSAYYKQVMLDHRNPLLDETLLDALAEVPDPWRVHKRLYLRAAALLPGNLFEAFPLATRSSLENWADVLRRPGPARTFVEAQLADGASSVWDFLDRDGVRALAARVLAQAAGAGRGHWDGIRPALRRFLYAAFPRFAAETHARRSRAHVVPAELLMRTLVLKDWLDRGSRAPSAAVHTSARLVGD